MKNKDITIITINYNNLLGLKKTMESVFDQTYKNVEYVVIDGGSTDGSKEFIEENKNKLDYWVSEPDKGIYNAMNKGIDKAVGEYLLFLNSGDYLCDKDVLSQISLELNDYDIYYGNLIELNSNSSCNKKNKGTEGKEITISTFITGSISHPSSFIKRNLFEKYGFYDESLKIVSDWKFFLIALGMNNSDIKYLNIDVSYFDMTGISNTNIDLINIERKKVLLEIVPKSILSDCYKLIELQNRFSTDRAKMFLKLEKHFFARKINNIIFKVILKLYERFNK
ncbi:glycosyltransferase [Polaribacter sp. Z014]|uniref:glycosyltransferase family 2 protein n=1 Tax=Polaribacter sp. Z014 TaxID=2927126 RepID=UPI0020207031|nr:glycosyltransferase family 2 protein [Polaribacter sp. Z014]MCL7764202.1 glycosyltransferase [Polaribacter sp. Z014]